MTAQRVWIGDQVIFSLFNIQKINRAILPIKSAEESWKHEEEGKEFAKTGYPGDGDANGNRQRNQD